MKVLLTLMNLRRRVLLATLLTLAMPVSAAAQETIEYYGTDHLGSVRVVFDVNGTLLGRTDYLPYGEELATTGPVPAQKFTGQARDAEAGQDYFHARMYQPRTGRFNAVDPVYAGLFDPQQWNRYAYVANRPTVAKDPDGRNLMYVVPNLMCLTGYCTTNQPVDESGGGGLQAFANWMLGVALDLVPTTIGVDNSDLNPKTGYEPSTGVKAIVGVATVAAAIASGKIKFPNVLGKRGGLLHLMKRHGAGSEAANVSTFLEGLGENEIKDLVREAAASSDKWVRETNGLNVLVVDLGRTIGSDPDGNALSAIRVVVDDFANVVTTYPVLTPK